MQNAKRTHLPVVLGSSSPARLATLRAAGIDPIVVRPEVDEESVQAPTASELTSQLAKLKGEWVRDHIAETGSVQPPYILFACDSVLEIEGRLYGKPGTPEAAIVRWYRMRGREALLFTGHYVGYITDEPRESVGVARTEVQFADVTDAEISAYAATGEPQRAAGGFTIDGFGGAFVTSVTGDPHNVVGISLPMIRQMVIDFGLSWPQLWREPNEES